MGDDQTLPGASAPTNLSTSATLTVLGHAAPSLSVASGNNQTVIVGAQRNQCEPELIQRHAGPDRTCLAGCEFARQRVSGPIGGELIASGSTQSYTAVLNTSTVGTQIQTFALNAGDDHTLPGHCRRRTFHQCDPDSPGSRGRQRDGDGWQWFPSSRRHDGPLGHGQLEQRKRECGVIWKSIPLRPSATVR